MTTDKPHVNLSFSELDSIESPEPFVYTTKASKRVTFPDVYGMDAEEGEKFLLDMRDKPDGQVIKEWLSETDQKTLAADKLTLRQRQTLLMKALNYYEAQFGTQGEGDASAS